jgi:hypothetical protein
MTDKAWGFFNVSPSQSLCVFFWQMVLAPVILLIATIFIVAAVAALVFMFGYGIGGLVLTILHHFLPDSWFLAKGEFNWRFIVASLLIWFTLIGGIALRIYSKYRREVKIEEGTYKPSVTIEYIKAKKRKICPFIEFK